VASITLTQVAQFAALELGVLDSGEGLSAQQLADFLYSINAAIDNRSSEQAEVLSVLIATFVLTAAQKSYTIGTGQNFDTARPVAITAAQHILTVSAHPYETPIEVQHARQWAANMDRGSSSLVVRKLFYDRQFPTGNVYLSPIPLTASSIELTMWQPLGQFADATTPLTVPPGYSDWYNLLGCICMAPQFEMAVPASVTARYEDEIGRIRNLNAQLLGQAPPAGQTSAVETPGTPPVVGQ